MERFKILILDDEGLYAESHGYARVIDFFRKTGFLPSTTNMRTSSEDAHLRGYEFIDFVVWGGGTNYQYDTIIQILIKGVSPDLLEADVIFIDMHWNRTEINADSALLTVEKWDNYAKLYAAQRTKQYKIPETIAGLEIFRRLPVSDVPKILFSGANDTVPIRYLLHAFFSNRTQMEDFCIGDLGDGNRYHPEVEANIEKAFRKVQEEVAQGLTVSVADELLARVNEGRDLEVADIPGRRKDREQWSLRSLFPREFNIICNPNAPEVMIEEQRDRVRDTLISYPAVLYQLGGFTHAMSKGVFVYDEWKKKLKLLEVKEFSKEEGEKQRVQFIPIHDFWRKNEHWIGGEVDFRGLNDRICGHSWLFRGQPDRSGGLRIENEIDDLQIVIKDWVRQAGFYPGYLDYIVQVARLNAETRGQNALTILGEEDPGFFYIRLQAKGSREPIEDRHIKGFEETIRGIKKLNRIFKDRYSEGVEDIAKIICYHYKGAFSFVARHCRVDCQLTGNEIVPRIRKVDHTELGTMDVMYELKIPRAFINRTTT